MALYFPTLSHFLNGNGWSATCGEMRYEVERPIDGKMTAVVWYGPYCRQYAEEIGQANFPVTEEGVAAVQEWLARYAKRMNEAPERTVEERETYRRAQKK